MKVGHDVGNVGQIGQAEHVGQVGHIGQIGQVGRVGQVEQVEHDVGQVEHDVGHDVVPFTQLTQFLKHMSYIYPEQISTEAKYPLAVLFSKEMNFCDKY